MKTLLQSLLCFILAFAFCHPGDASPAAMEERLAEWEAERGEHHTLWPYDVKADFYDQFGLFPDVHMPGSGTMQRSRPEPGERTEAEALEAAKEALLAFLPTTRAALDALLPDTNFFPAFDTGAGRARTWVIVLRTPETGGLGIPLVKYQVHVPATGGDATIFFSGRNAGLPVTPAALPDALYYNPNGGRFFHRAEACPTVSEQYLPLSAFPKAQITAEPYVCLNACECAGDAENPTLLLASDPESLLYHNSKGGKFYHKNPACEMVDARYLPMDAIATEMLAEQPFDALLPCYICVQ